VSCCEHYNEANSIKGEEFLDQLSDYQLVKKSILLLTFLKATKTDIIP